MATRARSGADLASTINANTSAPSNTIVVSSSGNVTTANDLSITGNLIGAAGQLFVSNAYLQANFVSNTAGSSVSTDRLDVANANVKFITKSTALASNNSIINLINDREQVANAAVSYVTKAVHLTSNNALINLINDREQVANLAATLVDYWPSANIIAYVAAQSGNEPASMQTNTSIFIATGGETEVAIPYTNTAHLSVKLNGVRLTPDEDYTAANNTHIGNLLALSAADILTVTEYKQHVANVLNRTSSGGGGGGGGIGGSTSGYNTGGRFPNNDSYPQFTNIIEKFSFTSDANATDVGDLTGRAPPNPGRAGLSGQSSSTNGYTAGGCQQSPYAASNIIDKFPFASDSNATDVGDILAILSNATGQSSPTNGYVSGGIDFDVTPRYYNTIQKFPFSSDANSTDAADLSAERYWAAGQSSSSNGYTSGGSAQPGVCNIIDKFPFSSDSNATDVGDLTLVRAGVSGQSSSTHGYTSGGYSSPTCQGSNEIDKFAFASDGNATDVGDLSANKASTSGQSSTASGYVSGGDFNPTSTFFNVIEKFPFSSDSNTSDVGDLTVGCRRSMAGQQV